MDIVNYKVLISNLPVRQQCFGTKRMTWKKAEGKIVWLKQLNDKLFGGEEALFISRQDIFDTTNLRKKILKTIYWGYTSGMRGNHFVDLLRDMEQIERNLDRLLNTSNPTISNLDGLIHAFKNIKGLGLSTYSKLLYFTGIAFEEYPSLILDQQLINVFASKTYVQFAAISGINDYNKEQKYFEYLKIMDQLPARLETAGENIEHFIFTFGGNLKVMPNTE